MKKTFRGDSYISKGQERIRKSKNGMKYDMRLSEIMHIYNNASGDVCEAIREAFLFGVEAGARIVEHKEAAGSGT